MYYNHDPLRVSACPLTVHALLHIAPSIREIGPQWAAWAYPMERYCGDLKKNVKSRRHPYVSLNNYITADAHLKQIELMYNLRNDLSFEPPKIDHSFSHQSCTYFIFIPLTLA